MDMNWARDSSSLRPRKTILADPDIDFDTAAGPRLIKVRELIEHELEKQQTVNETMNLTITYLATDVAAAQYSGIHFFPASQNKSP
jgi:hypothetical protein